MNIDKRIHTHEYTCIQKEIIRICRKFGTDWKLFRNLFDPVPSCLTQKQN